MKSFFTVRYRPALILALWVFSGVCSAGIQLGGTRIVYPAADREASILVRNLGSADIMIQSWIEADARDQDADVPFAITPALARMGGNKQQMLRIFYHGKGLAEDRESVFWLNVQEIPQQAKEENSLQVAIRQRIKVFYRPAAVTATLEESASQLHWRLVTRDGAVQLEVQNPSALNISLGTLTLSSGQQSYNVQEQMIAPKSTAYMKVRSLGAMPKGQAQLHWESINDYGALIKHETKLGQ
ncbi:molecular chaperone [Pseudomonas sp. PH1b]|uniref:fimbrial biogenesis chaperone n=1 Tax=Pseudomonas sp. PH1b TaxID=1397282 RepID=UPI0004683995|nr:molecular chaperone [Pseudomonas sp. PH1b]